MKLIPLTQGQFAQVDDEDFNELSKYTWWYNQGYAFRYCPTPLGGKGAVAMHRWLIQAPKGAWVDHKDGCSLNNTQANLRFASGVQNSFNKRTPRNNRTGVKGVHYYRPTGKYAASIAAYGKRTFLGYHTTIEEAATAYAKAAQELHGEFARTS